MMQLSPTVTLIVPQSVFFMVALLVPLGLMVLLWVMQKWLIRRKKQRFQQVPKSINAGKRAFQGTVWLGLQCLLFCLFALDIAVIRVCNVITCL